MSSGLLNLILAITSIITTVTLVVTLGIVAWQTKHLGEQTKQLGKQIEQNTTISISQYFQNVNTQLLQHPDEAKSLIEENKEDAMTSIIFGALQLSFELQKGQKMDKPSRQSDKATIVYTLQQECMRKQWGKNKSLYDPEFVEFIEKILQERDDEKKYLSSTHPSQQLVSDINETNE